MAIDATVAVEPTVTASKPAARCLAMGFLDMSHQEGFGDFLISTLVADMKIWVYYLMVEPAVCIICTLATCKVFAGLERLVLHTDMVLKFWL